jgi:hypothetical protein
VACLGRIAASFIVLIISYVKGKTNGICGSFRVCDRLEDRPMWEAGAHSTECSGLPRLARYQTCQPRVQDIKPRRKARGAISVGRR